MGQNVLCRERRELENRIRACLHELSEHAQKASQLARRRESSTPLDFHSVQTAFSAVSERLKTLQECLEIHEAEHKCGMLPDLAIKVQVRPQTSTPTAESRVLRMDNSLSSDSDSSAVGESRGIFEDGT